MGLQEAQGGWLLVGKGSPPSGLQNTPPGPASHMRPLSRDPREHSGPRSGGGCFYRVQVPLEFGPSPDEPPIREHAVSPQRGTVTSRFNTAPQTHACTALEMRT